MAHVLAVKPGKVNPAQKKILQEAGVILIEMDDPNDLRIVRAEVPEIDGSELSWAAIAAIDQVASVNAAAQFTKNVRSILARKMQARHHSADPGEAS